MMDKRLKTKMIQIRVTPENNKIFDDYAKKHKISKTELFMRFLEMIKEKKI
jgi:hypothetical protein